MKTNTLGQSSLTVSALGLGCMGMSEFYGQSNDTVSLQTLDAALALGVNFFDTADTYGLGHNEQLLGQWLRHQPRDQVVLATKFGIVRQAGQYERSIDNSPAYIRQACEASLQRLGVDYIDLYYCHRRNPETPVEEMVGAMAELVKEGKVRALGLSEVSVDTLRRAANVHPIAAVQNEYSLWWRKPEEGLLQACEELGTNLVAYSPLGRAFLTATLSSTEQLAADDFRRNNPRFQGDALQHNQQLVATLAAFAQERGVTPAQVALAWLLAKSPRVIPIPGTRRVAYLTQNVAALDVTLSAAEVAWLDQLFNPADVRGERYPEGGFVGIEE
ncbi:MAG: aldo/keto reductase [Thiothrix sp.]